MYTKNQKIILIGYSAVVITLLYFLFSYLLNNDFGDLPDHFKHAQAIANGTKQIPPNFLVYSIVSLFKDYNYQHISFILILVSGLYFKFILSFLYFRSKSIWLNFNLAIVCATIMLLIIAVPMLKLKIPFYYFNYFTTNIWHNTTTQFLVPFSMLLFYFLFIEQENTDNKTKDKINFKVTILILLNLFIKPSFMFVIAVFLAIRLIVGKFLKQSFLSFHKSDFYYLILSVVIIVLQYIFVYYLNIGSYQEEKSKVVISFFHKMTLNQILLIPIAFMGSFLFPIIYFVAKGIKNISKIELYSVLVLFISIALFFSLAELGPREGHKNFYWQIVPSASILFVIVLGNFFKDFSDFSVKKRSALLVVLCLHLLSGIFYLNKIITELDYS
jgi:hypothetical protein